MKKFTPTLILLFTIITSCNINKSNYFVSANAHSLFGTYRDVISQTNTQNCVYDNTDNPTANPKVKGNRRCTYSAMPAKGYNKGTVGFISFASWYWFEHVDEHSCITFHTAWFSDSVQANAVLCKNTWPNPIVNPFLKTDNIDNHVFEVMLVPVFDYQKESRKETTFEQADKEDAKNPFATILVKAIDIKSINDLYVEDENGYMSKTLAASYTDPHSSVGIICEVVLKNNETKDCYVFNNYDASNTMIWKNIKK